MHGLERAANIQSSLKVLSSRLSHNEIRKVKSWAYKQKLGKDIIGCSPLEVVIQIFGYLEPWHAFNHRRVSRRWAEVLSSNQLVTFQLEPWLSKGVPTLRFPPETSTRLKLSSTAEHIDAFQHGKAFSRMSGDWNILEPGQGPTRDVAHPFVERVAYFQGHMAWIDPSRDCVYVSRFEDGKTFMWRPENREKLMSIAMSDTVVVVSTYSGRVYAYDLEKASQHSIRLSSAGIVMICVTGCTVAILLKIPTASVPTEDLRIIIWKMTDLRSIEFPIASNDCKLSSVPRNLLIDYHEASVIYFATRRISATRGYWGEDKLTFFRFDLEGTLLAQGDATIPIQSSDDLLRKSAYASDMVGCYTVLSYLRDTSDLRAYDRYRDNIRATIQFDTIQNQFIDPYNSQKTEWYSSHSGRAGSMIFASTHLWKHVTYSHGYHPLIYVLQLKVDSDDDLCYSRIEDAEMNTLYTDSFRGQRSPCSFDIESDGARDDERRIQNDSTVNPKCWLFGDEIFLVRAEITKFTVFCFDKNIAMRNEDALYRKARQEARQCRLA